MADPSLGDETYPAAVKRDWRRGHRDVRPPTRCAVCGERAWFIDGCPTCRRITEVIHDIA